MPADATAPSFFQIGSQRFEVPFRPAWVMGIVNVTPDSFSDGGLYLDHDTAVERAVQQVEEGARIIDIGAESTRPGSLGVPPAEQIRRAIPVIEGVRRQFRDIPISIDTCVAEVAHAALQAGANIVNDTSAMRDDEGIARLIAESGASVILMHRRGTPRDMQEGGGPVYDNVVEEIADFLAMRIDDAVKAGIDRERIAVDAGIGFGKRGPDNLLILNEIGRFAELGRPVVIGASRKKFLGDLLDIPDPRRRLVGSLACAVVAALHGASILRAHDVKETVQSLKVLRAITDTAAT